MKFTEKQQIFEKMKARKGNQNPENFEVYVLHADEGEEDRLNDNVGALFLAPQIALVCTKK